MLCNVLYINGESTKYVESVLLGKGLVYHTTRCTRCARYNEKVTSIKSNTTGFVYHLREATQISQEIN